MSWPNRTWVVLISTGGLCLAQNSSAQLVIAPGIRYDHVANDQSTLGWDLVVGYCDEPANHFWISGHYSRLKAQRESDRATVVDEVHRFGLTGGSGRTIGENWVLQYGFHADYINTVRSAARAFSSESGSYKVKAIGLGLAGRMMYSLGDLTSVFFEVDPGYSVVIDQESIEMPLPNEQVANGLYVGFTMGVVVELSLK